jgi:hypothetical protein
MKRAAMTYQTALLAPGLLVCFLVAAMATLLVIERQRPTATRAAELSYLPKGEYLKLAVLGYRQLAADVIWLQVVQHFGKRNETTEGYLWAYHAVDVVTDLDPRFVHAYRAAGTILGVWAGRVHESIAILKKGMEHNPEAWELPFFIGYNYFYELCDYRSAATHFQIASLLSGAPTYLPQLAARMTVEAGDPDAALEFLLRLHQQVQDDRLKAGLERRIRQVSAERDIRLLEEAGLRFKTRHGRLPAGLDELVTQGFLRALPEEPHGGKYELRADGTVQSTSLPERLRVHRKGECRGTAAAPTTQRPRMKGF